MTAEDLTAVAPALDNASRVAELEAAVAKQEGTEPGTTTGGGTPPLTSRQRVLLTAKDIKGMPDPKWIIRSILSENTLGCLFGAPGTAKSLTLLDLAAHIAEGTPWFGLTVSQSPVVYLSLEGQARLKGRIHAWEAVNGRDFPANVQFDLECLSMLEKGDVDAMIAAYPRDAVIFIDTVARSLGGADENKDMGRFVANCDRLREAVSGTVLLCHHCGKDESKGMRGHTALLGAVNVTIEIKRGQDKAQRVLHVHKNNFGPEEWDIGTFRLETVVFEPDNPESDTSCAIVPEETLAAQGHDPTPKETMIHGLRGNQSMVYDCYLKILQDKPKSAYGVTKQELKDAFYSEYKANAQAGKSPSRTAFYDAHTALIGKGLLMKHGEVFFLPGVTPETPPLPEDPQPEQGKLTGQEGCFSQSAHSV
ncbi:MAG: AAA family ATPase [Deltaproteobacteria bacterium]|nr:AAA family ATPase [Deltaproteobacteria bacterium]